MYYPSLFPLPSSFKSSGLPSRKVIECPQELPQRREICMLKYIGPAVTVLGLCLTVFAQSLPEVRRLEPGKPIDRELAGGQSHSYEIALAEGQYVKIVVEPRGIDVVVQVLGPDGKPITEFDAEIRK